MNKRKTGAWRGRREILMADTSGPKIPWRGMQQVPLPAQKKWTSTTPSTLTLTPNSLTRALLDPLASFWILKSRSTLTPCMDAAFMGLPCRNFAKNSSFFLSKPGDRRRTGAARGPPEKAPRHHRRRRRRRHPPRLSRRSEAPQSTSPASF